MPFSFEKGPNIPKTGIEKEKSKEELQKETTENLRCLLECDNRGKRTLQEIIAERIYGGEKTSSKRAEKVKEWGYEPEILKEKGLEIIEEWETLLQKAELSEEEKEKFRRLDGWRRTFSKDRQHQVLHTDLTVGLTAEVSRQMGKFLAASLAEKPEEVRKIMEQEAMEVTPEMMQEYVQKRNSPDKENLFRLQNEIIGKLSPEEKQRQYSMVRMILNRESRIEGE